MFAMWCWLHPFGQPDILMWIRLVSGSSMPIDSTRSRTAWFRPIELVMPSLHEAEPGQRAPHLVGGLVPHPAEHQVLVHRRARVAARVPAHDVREAAELLRREVAAHHLDLHGREARLALRHDADCRPS